MKSNSSVSIDATTASDITDKCGYAARWSFSKRHVDNLLAQGLPHLKVGKRRVRIMISEADAWMRERFYTQRRGSGGRAHTKASAVNATTPNGRADAERRPMA